MKDLYAERVEKMEEYYEKLPVAESNDASTENINNILDKLENNKREETIKSKIGQ